MQAESDRNRRLLEREEMVRTQIKHRGVRDPRVLDAMLQVPREWFLPAHIADQAYRDCALPIECDQTISQPYIVAHMTELLELEPTDRVLEIGTGSGYQTAILALLAERVFTVERHAELSRLASDRVSRLGRENVDFLIGDGSLGWPAHAPYDAILVTAGAPDIPDSLKNQISLYGRIIIPVGGAATQVLVKLKRTETGYERYEHTPCRFVKLVGQEGWQYSAD